jgi:hypothetical protein
MALPTSGQLSVDDIYTEINGLSIAAAGDSNVSFSNLAYGAGFTPPQAISDFYGYSAWYPSWAGAMNVGGTSRVVFSSEGTQNININCYYSENSSLYGWTTGSTYSASTSTTTFNYTTWQDYNGTTPDSFVLNGNNQFYVQRSIPAFNAASITIYLYPPSFGSFNNVSYSTSNGTVTSYTATGSLIQITMSTSAGSLTSHSLTVYFNL